MERAPISTIISSDIYKDIENGEFKAAIEKLSKKVSSGENPRAVYSLLGYCHFQIGNYKDAINMYDYLSKVYPDYQEYKLYQALCLYKTGKLETAGRIADSIDDPSLGEKVEQLKAAVSFGRHNYSEAREHLKKVGKKDVSGVINEGCILFKEKKFGEALKKFREGKKMLVGYHSQLYYNIALCHYRMEEYEEALKYIKIIVQKSREAVSKQSVGEEEKCNEKLAHEVKHSGMIEALNLRAAIEYERGNAEKAKKILKDLSSTLSKSGLQKDPTTYHNEAIVGVNDNCAESISKLNELLNDSEAPPETFQNLIHLYCKYRFFDFASDMLKTKPQLASKYIKPDEHEYIKALIQEEKDPELAIKQYDGIIKSYTKKLDKLAKKLEQSGGDSSKSIANEKKAIVERLVCVVSNKARIYWEAKNFAKTEEVFASLKDYCKDNEIFNMNMGHSLFMQKKKHERAAEYYEEIVERHKDNLNEVDIFVLANLSLCYIYMDENEKAEKLLATIKKHEGEAIMKNPKTVLFHHCSVNLVIGTLYCSKSNFEFGLDLIIKNLSLIHISEPTRPY
eukprot:TRINITY_DN13219_c0_g3_i7.p1 TRINITY_DN13219_c0_g3~~TRINITY_DN13219_c0_g3_i7.p1  ORF type:complete len:565 (-),score=208.82 TRINITY_DN13219_c0_g3_i7:62-1756(-)